MQLDCYWQQTGKVLKPAAVQVQEDVITTAINKTWYRRLQDHALD